MNCGPLIKQTRESKGIMQSFVAKKIGLSCAGLWKIESGITDVSIDRLEQIATVLGVKVKDLIPK